MVRAEEEWAEVWAEVWAGAWVEEIRLLKDEAQDLIRNVKGIEERIGNLERGK
jgi:hypothetical protein